MRTAKRLISILLAAACFMLAVSGVYCALRGKKHFSEDSAYIENLRLKTEMYSDIKKLTDSAAGEYNTASLGYAADREDYESRASGHREELAIYTATRSGIQTGEEQLNSAWGPLEEGKAQLAAADAVFQPGYEQYLAAKQQIADGWTQYYQGVEQYTIGYTAVEAGETLLRSSLDAIVAARAQNAQRDGTDDISRAAEAAAALSPEDRAYFISVLNYLELYKQQLSDLGYDISQITAMADALALQYGYNSEAEMVAALQALLADDEKYAAAVKIAADPAAVDAELASAEENIRLQLDSLAATKQELAAALPQLEQAKTMLETAEAELQAYEPQILAGKAQLDAAKAALAQGEAQLWAAVQTMEDTKKELADTEITLGDEIAGLAEEKAELDRRQSIIDRYEDDLERMESARLRLLDYDDIAALTDSGEELLDAAVDVADYLEVTAADKRDDLYCCGAVSVAALLISFLAVSAAYGKFRPRFLSFLPAADCIILALAAQKLRFTGVSQVMFPALLTVLLASALLALTVLCPEKRNV